MNKRGFTLVESVVALVLAAAGFAALYQLYASTAAAERAANETVFAARLAESLLADPDPDPRGEINDYGWDFIRIPAPGQRGLDQLTVVVTTPSGRDIRVVTERPARINETFIP